MFFKDKDTTGFRMEKYFDAEVIKNRKLQQLPAWDMYDVPVTVAYTNAVTTLCDSVLVISRWMNGMAIWTDETRLNRIAQLNCITRVEKVMDYPEGGVCTAGAEDWDGLMHSEQQLAKGQTAHLQINHFKKAGINAKGIRVAVIDAGFKGLANSTVLNHVRISGRILYTRDFVRKTKDVDGGSKHGTAVLSCIAGMLDTINLGLAPNAEFLLYRTEKMFNEKFNEEEYWLAAAEDAEQRGARIINTSLGYTGRRYFRKDMDGKHSLLSKATGIAARKGILVVCSAGNEGSNFWRIIVTPADGDSVLAVGALNPWTGVQANWSSVGPSFDKRVKPNVCAYGFVMGDNSHGSVSEVPGTSFSSPLVAGFAACVLQLHPQYSVTQLISEIEKSGHLYPYYDYAHGYGTPQASYFTDTTQKTIEPTFLIKETDDSLEIKIYPQYFKPAYVSDNAYLENYIPTLEDEEMERDSYHISEYSYTSNNSVIHTCDPGYFYYGLKNTSNYLDWYYVLNVRQPNVLRVSKEHMAGMKTFVFHYRGYTQTWPNR